MHPNSFFVIWYHFLLVVGESALPPGMRAEFQPATRWGGLTRKRPSTQEKRKNRPHDADIVIEPDYSGKSGDAYICHLADNTSIASTGFADNVPLKTMIRKTAASFGPETAYLGFGNLSIRDIQRALGKYLMPNSDQCVASNIAYFGKFTGSFSAIRGLYSVRYIRPPYTKESKVVLVFYSAGSVSFVFNQAYRCVIAWHFSISPY